MSERKDVNFNNTSWIKAPCYACPQEVRHEGCHGDCDKYKAYQQEVFEMHRAAQERRHKEAEFLYRYKRKESK